MDGASKSLRLFVAVPVSDEVCALAARCIGELSKSGADARWLEPTAIHLTLRFLGQMRQDRLPALKRALGLAARGHGPFDIEFDRLGCFGPLGRPRVVWAGVGVGAESLSALAEGLSGALDREGIPRESRPFSAHLTLGRLRSSRGAAALAERLKQPPAVRWPCRVERLVLYSSRLAALGAVHTLLSEQRLVK